MTLLPIVDRELRVGARRIRTYRTRAFTALVAGLIAGGMLLIGSWVASPSDLGAGMFRTLVVLAFLYCLIVGARSTGDCLSEEKREGTIGLLFLSDLKSYDVVLGKLAATSLNSFYGLLAMFPLLAIPLTIGGVTPGEYWRVVLVLVHTLFLALAMGMFVSSISRQERNAMAGTYGLIFFFTCALPIFEFVLSLDFIQAAHPTLLWLSPSYACHLAFEGAYVRQSENFRPTLLTIHVLSWIFLALASLLLPRFWQQKPMTRRALRLRRHSRGRTSGAINGAKLRARLLDVNPVLWLASEDRSLLIGLWVVIGLLTVGTMGGISALLGSLGGLGMGMMFLNYAVSFVYFLILRVLVAAQACRFSVEARRTGALELLLATPLSVEEIMRGHLLALRRLFLWPAVIVVGIQSLLFFAAVFSLKSKDEWALAIFQVFTPITSALNFLGDAWALTWVGMWLGLSSKNITQATIKTLVRVLVWPLAAIVFFPPFWALLVFPGGLIVWVLKSVLIAEWAKQKLRQNFRLVAARPYEPDSGGWFWRQKPGARVPPVIRT
jgi:ABC-type transport system involved in multi-copper enzyme maturation permease subunit